MHRTRNDDYVPDFLRNTWRYQRGASAIPRCHSHNRIGRCPRMRSEEHTSELQSLMRISYAVFCLKKKSINTLHTSYTNYTTMTSYSINDQYTKYEKNTN